MRKMDKTTTYKIKLDGGLVKDIKQNSDGTVSISMEMLDENKPNVNVAADVTFVRIPVSSVKVEDSCFWYTPENDEERAFKEEVIKILENENEKITDFCIPFDYTDIKLFGNTISDIYYGDASCNSWIKNAEQNGWKMLKVSQYRLLLAWMLKVLIEEVCWEKSKAWEAICTDSELLGELKWKDVFGFENIVKSGKRYLLPDHPDEKKGCYEACGGCNGRDWNYPLSKIMYDCRRDCGKAECSYLCIGFMAKY